jgi:isovaleryl-CoA dehydrogenase
VTSSALSPAIRQLRGEAEEIARTVLAPRAAEVDERATWPEHSIRALAGARLTALHVPENLGGHGQGLLALAAVTEPLAQSCASSALCFAMHCVGTAVIAAKPTEHQRERYLRPIAAGEHITTLSLSEPGTGSHFYLPSTELASVDGSYVVRGTKHFVTNGGHADSYVVSTRALTNGQGEFSCLVVDADTEGLHWKGTWEGLGMRGNSSLTMQLDGARVPADNLLGQQGDQIWYVFEVVAPYFLTAMAATYLGVGQAALDYTIAHLRTRRHEHSGEPLAASDVLQHRVAVMWSRIAAARELLHSASYLGDSGHPEALVSILSAKAEVADVAVLVTNEAMTLCGGAAYRENGDLSRMLRDARASHVMAPTTDMLRLWAGRSLLGQPLL